MGPMQDSTGAACCVRALHLPVVHPKETAGEEAEAAAVEDVEVRAV